MKKLRLTELLLLLCIATGAASAIAQSQSQPGANGPDPREIPVPEIQTALGSLPGVNELPARQDLPDVMVMNDGTRVATSGQWKQRREEMKRVLEYYAVGAMPPPPGNVKARVLKTQLALDGKLKYRVVGLAFGPGQKIKLTIGILTPVDGGPFPVLIMPGGTPPGSAPVPALPHRPGRGPDLDALLPVEPDLPDSVVAPTPAPEPIVDPTVAEASFGNATNLAGLATRYRELFQRGYALVTFNNTDCAEDSRLRNTDGSWTFRTTRFYPAYPGYDWGILAGWAWGVSRIVDYLATDPAIDSAKIIVSGTGRTGKSALIAAAFDERIAMAAPCASGGGGIGAWRLAGADRGGGEGLADLMKRSPQWFSPHLHEFWGRAERLPFDEHWFIALTAPRPFLALEGLDDKSSNANAVQQSILAAKLAYAFSGAADSLGVNYAAHEDAFTREDLTALLDFADEHLRGLKSSRRFDQFPPQQTTDSGTQPTNK